MGHDAAPDCALWLLQDLVYRSDRDISQQQQRRQEWLQADPLAEDFDKRLKSRG